MLDLFKYQFAFNLPKFPLEFPSEMEFLLSAVLCVAELPQPFPTGSSTGTK